MLRKCSLRHRDPLDNPIGSGMRSKTHGAPSGGLVDAYLALAYGDLSGRLAGAYVLIGYTPP